MLRVECWDEGFEDERGFAGAGHSGDRAQPAAWHIDLERTHSVDRFGLQVNAAGKEDRLFVRPVADVDVCRSGEETGELRVVAGGEIVGRALCDDRSA